MSIPAPTMKRVKSTITTGSKRDLGFSTASASVCSLLVAVNLDLDLLMSKSVLESYHYMYDPDQPPVPSRL